MKTFKCHSFGIKDWQKDHLGIYIIKKYSFNINLDKIIPNILFIQLIS